MSGILGKTAPTEREMRLAMAFATAQRDANLEKGQDDLKLLKKAIYDAPIILCSTHGHYDRNTDPVKWIVPPNTFILEAQTIGDLTLTLLDKPLWDLLQGGMRWGLYKYITGKYNKLSKKGLEVHDVFKQTLANMILYKPGDEIYERVLSIGGGRHQKDASARALFEGMGFFRFDPAGPKYEYQGYGKRDASGAPNPYEILGGLHRKMVEDRGREMTDHSFVECVSGIDTNPVFRSGESIGVNFHKALSDYPADTLKIFIFSSCAAVEKDTSEEAKERWAQIATLQQKRILEARMMGIHTLLGGSYGSMVENATIVKTKRELSGSPYLRDKEEPPSSFLILPETEGAIKFFSREDPDLQSKYLYNKRPTKRTKIGGTRRFLRKSKSNNTKTRRTL